MPMVRNKEEDMFGIIDENKKFILLDENRETLRRTALMLAKQTENGFVLMFNEDTIDEAITEYADDNIETAYNGEKYVKGYAPAIDNEYQSKQREKAYVVEVDPITAHISRLRDDAPESEEIAKLLVERTAKREEIKAKYPYVQD